jgi:phosphopantothenoylcysteine decarboxylase/phosphopantothenate--cysteine ligase
MMNKPLLNKRILLGVTGSIAAYKSAELIRLLRELGAEVRVIMSAGASAFITAMTLQALSGQRVYESLLDVESETQMSHISLARWADLVLIAPATAHCLAKLAMGFADDLLTTACLATTAPIAIAPAMNVMMWSNAATQANIKQLTARNVRILGPDSGIQACGETGEGRMLEPENIVREVVQLFQHSQLLTGKKVLITAGPTQEAIDPVRYLTNHSSGKMGYALAKAAALAGADVTLISGPTTLSTPPNVKKIVVSSAQQMLDTVLTQMTSCDIFIAAAAVADYRVKNISSEKIKKTETTMQLELERNPDILATIAQLPTRPFVVGFAAETENLIENAQRKLTEKKLDCIIANRVGENMGFNSDYNELVVLSANHDAVKHLPYASKDQLANELIILLTDLVQGQSANRATPDQAPAHETIVPWQTNGRNRQYQE